MHPLPPQTPSPLTGRGRRDRAVPAADDRPLQMCTSVATPNRPLPSAQQRSGLRFPPTSEMEAPFKAGSKFTSHPSLTLVTREGDANAELCSV